MAWLLVVIAGLLETGFAVCLKQSNGLSKLWPTVGFSLFALGSFGLLTLALRRLEVGPAYAVWTGIGAAGTVVFGMVFFNEGTSLAKIASVGLIVAGVIGLNLFGAVHGGE
jgi:quaternary ammonium compound-resistance protein SugE